MFGVSCAAGARVLALIAAAALGFAAAGCRDIHVDPYASLGTGGAGGGGGGSAGIDASDEGGAGAGGTGGTFVCPNAIVGWATIAGVTTGGGDGTAAVTVNALDSLALDELTANAAGTDQAVIVIKGMIAVPAAMQPFQVSVGSNKTITGADAQSGISGGGFNIQSQQNVIIQNLVINDPAGPEAITVQTSTHVWIDHCEISGDQNKGGVPWLVDIKRASDYVTVSWNSIHDQDNVCQIGHSDGNQTEDMGHLRVTYHHNLFHTARSGTPRVRFGTVHVFNNHYSNDLDYGVASEMNAQVLVENNYFESSTEPLTNQHFDTMQVPGVFQPTVLTDNIIDMRTVGGVTFGVSKIAPTPGMTFTFVPPYTYKATNLDPTDHVPALVDTCAGPGKI